MWKKKQNENGAPLWTRADLRSLPGEEPHFHWILLPLHGDGPSVLQMKLRVSVLH